MQKRGLLPTGMEDTLNQGYRLARAWEQFEVTTWNQWRTHENDLILIEDLYGLKTRTTKKKKKSDLIYTFIGGLLYKSEIDDN